MKMPALKTLFPLVAILAATCSDGWGGTTYTFNGSVSSAIDTAGNWTSSTGSVPGVTTSGNDTAILNGTAAGSLALTFGAAFGGSNGILWSLTSDQVGNVTITNSASGAQTFRFAGISIASGAGAFTLGAAGTANKINLTLGSGAGTYAFTNNSASTATIGANVTTSGGGSGTTPRIVSFGGTGNWDCEGILANNVNASPTAVTVAGTGTVLLNGANTYTGGTTVSSGALATGSTGTLGGAAAVTVANGATLTLGNATSINDLATLSLGATSALNLDFTGTETVGSLFDSSTSSYIAAGIYTAAQLDTLFANTDFGGSGSLNVAAVPEPGAGGLLGGSLFVLGVLRRLRRAAAAV